ncbi:MAG: PQQ-binding-like beta-propeller repeat protein, partial [Arenicellales bacterium]
VLFSMLGLSACGGQAALKADQAVRQVPSPTAVQNKQVKVLWRASTAGSQQYAARFEPVIRAAVVYTASENGRIEGFSLETGKRVLKADLRTQLISGLGANEALLVAVTAQGEVVALNRADGTEKWRFNSGRSLSAAAVMSEQIIAIRTIDGYLIGLNAATGEQIWGIERAVSALSLGLDSSSLIAGEGVISGFSNGRVLASNIFNGQIFWEKRTFRPQGKNDIERLVDIDAAPVLSGTTVLVGAYQGGVVAYGLRDGVEAWRNSEVSTRKRMSVLNQNIAVTESNSDLSLLSFATGERQWQQTELRGHGLSAPILLENTLLVGSLEGVLYSLETAEGKLISQIKLSSAPITALYQTEQGLLVYSASSGALILVSL